MSSQTSDNNNATVIRMLSEADSFLNTNRRDDVNIDCGGGDPQGILDWSSINTEEPSTTKDTIFTAAAVSDKLYPSYRHLVSNECYLNMHQTKTGHKSYSGGGRKRICAEEERDDGNEMLHKKTLYKDTTDSAHARGLITSLQYEVSSLTAANKKSKVEFENHITDMQSIIERSENKNHLLSVQLKVFYDREIVQTEELNQYRTKLKQMKYDSDLKISSMMKKIGDMDILLADENAKVISSSQRLEQLSSSYIVKISQLKNELEGTRTRLTFQQKQISEFLVKEHVWRRCQDDLAEFQRLVRDLQHKVKQYEESEVINSAMKSNLVRMSELDQENKKLKEESKILKQRNVNIALLEEQLTGVEAQLDRWKQHCTNLQGYKLENVELKERVRELDVVKDTAMMNSETQMVGELQACLLLKTEREGNLTVDLKGAERDNLNLKAEISELTSQLAVAQETNNEQQEEHLQKTVVQVTKRQDFQDDMKKQIEAEVKMMSRKLQMKLDEAEKKLSYYTDLEQQRQNGLDLMNMKGDLDPRTTKIVHLKENPADTAKQLRLDHVEKLTEDNHSLQLRLTKLKFGGDQEGGSCSDSIIKSKELDEMKQQLSSAELKNQRFKEMFSKKVKEFREVYYTLTGYRVDIVSDNKYKLSSVFANDADDYLLFAMSSKGEMQLLETEYSKTLMDLIESFLCSQNSIPAFLGRLTLDLISNQTML